MITTEEFSDGKMTGPDMNESIVERLREWLEARRPTLARAGIEITDRIPQPFSTLSWKAGIGLVKDDIFVSYTVWERTAFQTELIIVDGPSGETLRSEDATLNNPKEIGEVLDGVVAALVAGNYRRA